MMLMIMLPLPNTKHPLPTTTAGSQWLTPTQRHHYYKKGGRARRLTAPTDLAQIVAPQARLRRGAWARGTVQRHVDAEPVLDQRVTRALQR